MLTIDGREKRSLMLSNWGGNLVYGSGAIEAPATIEELSEIIRSGKVRPIGTMHSFSKVVVGEGTLVSAAGLAFEPALDKASSTVKVSAATRFGDLALFLEKNGVALKNMGSLPHISIAGAAATGTHGSGDKNQILSSSLSAYSFLNSKGELVRYQRGDENFEACRVGLGAYGLWVSVELDVVPSFQIRQDVYLDIPWEVFYEDPTNLTSAGYSVSLFTKWGEVSIDQVWVKALPGDKAGLPIAGISPEKTSRKELAPGVGDNLTQQGGVEGPWLDRLPHFRLDATPSAGNEIQTEYFIQRKNIVGAVKAVNKIAEQINHTLIITEVRTIAQDDAWLSPMNRGDSVALHFTWVNDTPAVDKAVAALEEVLAEFDPIPHWGKVHHFDKSKLEKVHARLGKARAVFDELDPEGVFNTEYLKSLGVRN